MAADLESAHDQNPPRHEIHWTMVLENILENRHAAQSNSPIEPGAN
jgi:hypothetical protein